MLGRGGGWVRGVGEEGCVVVGRGGVGEEVVEVVVLESDISPSPPFLYLCLFEWTYMRHNYISLN